MVMLMTKSVEVTYRIQKRQTTCPYPEPDQSIPCSLIPLLEYLF